MWWLVLAPLVAGLVCLWVDDLKRQVAVSLVACMATGMGILGLAFGFLEPSNLAIILPGMELSLAPDGIGLVLAGFALLLWVSSLLFSLSWFKPHVDTRRYMLLLGLTSTGILLTFLAGDFLTLFLGFELMSLASWGLVVHTQSEEAYKAGGLYLYLGVAGGMLLLTGLALIYYFSGSLSFTPTFTNGAPVELIAILMLAGFGIKAGMIPVHIWLPEAHPAAPVPASALLSGILIKTGAYGMMRTLGLAADFPQVLKALGLTVLLLGIFTMSFGVVMALLQGQAKRMLAFHSISQMGYVITGLGTAAFLGAAGGESLTGAVYHMLNHSVFKALLFLVAGSVYLYAGHLNLYKLGGLSKILPMTCGLALIAALGITGFPGLNGFASKTMLHHGLLTAVKELPMLIWVERIFVVVSAGTVCSFIKFTWFIFGKKADAPINNPGTRETWPMLTGMGLLAAAVVALGAFPYIMAGNILVPAMASLTSFGVANLYVHIYSWHSIMDIAIAFALGGFIFWAGCKWHIFHLSPPPWFSARYWGGIFVSSANSGLTNSELGWGRICAITGKQIELLEHSGEQLLQHADSKPETRLQRATSVINLNFDTLLVMAVLSIVLLLYFPLSGIG